MRQAILPFLEYLLLQVVVLIIGLNVVREKELGFSELVKSWVFGQMLCFAMLQVLAVPMILLRWKFNILFWSYLAVCLVAFAAGLWNAKDRKWKLILDINDWNWLAVVLLAIAVILILWQAGIYFFGMHLDEDDARWIAEANDALEYGNMMTRSFNTGEYVGAFVMREDVSSPWPMLFAVLSRLLLNTRVSIVAHTIYPTVEIIFVYCIYWLMGKEFFKEWTACLTFVLLTMVVTVLYGVTDYTQGTFTLIRIWQGKATVAGVAIPLFLYLFICINKDNKLSDWLKVVMAGTAVSLMSGMGIIIGGVMIGVYGAYSIIVYQNWKRIPFLICSCVPSIVFLLINYYLRG